MERKSCVFSWLSGRFPRSSPSIKRMRSVEWNGVEWSGASGGTREEKEGGRKEGSREERKEERKEGKKEGRKGGRRKERKEGRKGGRKELVYCFSSRENGKRTNGRMHEE